MLEYDKKEVSGNMKIREQTLPSEKIIRALYVYLKIYKNATKEIMVTTPNEIPNQTPLFDKLYKDSDGSELTMEKVKKKICEYGIKTMLDYIDTIEKHFQENKKPIIEWKYLCYLAGLYLEIEQNRNNQSDQHKPEEQEHEECWRPSQKIK